MENLLTLFHAATAGKNSNDSDSSNDSSYSITSSKNSNSDSDNESIDTIIDESEIDDLQQEEEDMPVKSKTTKISPKKSPPLSAKKRVVDTAKDDDPDMGLSDLKISSDDEYSYYVGCSFPYKNAYFLRTVAATGEQFYEHRTDILIIPCAADHVQIHLDPSGRFMTLCPPIPGWFAHKGHYVQEGGNVADAEGAAISITSSAMLKKYPEAGTTHRMYGDPQQIWLKRPCKGGPYDIRVRVIPSHDVA